MTDDEFSARQNLLLKRMPEELRPVLSHMAYQRGHAYGYQEVLIHIEDMVCQLEGPVALYGRRMERLGQDWKGA